jgi:hypothetical protein
LSHILQLSTQTQDFLLLLLLPRAVCVVLVVGSDLQLVKLVFDSVALGYSGVALLVAFLDYFLHVNYTLLVLSYFFITACQFM